MSYSRNFKFGPPRWIRTTVGFRQCVYSASQLATLASGDFFWLQVRDLPTVLLLMRQPTYLFVLPAKEFGRESEIRTRGWFPITGFQDQRLKPLGHLSMAVGAGFEPAEPIGSPVFGTGAISHSATRPIGGTGAIRTRDTLAGIPSFQDGAFNPSATVPTWTPGADSNRRPTPSESAALSAELPGELL